MIIESLGIALLIFCSEQMLLFSSLNKQLKTMTFCIHQNFLTLIDLVLSRLPSGVELSSWVSSLQLIVETKKIKPLKRSEHSTCIKQNCDIISNCIRTVLHLIPRGSSPSIAILIHILSNLDKYSIATARSYLVPMKNNPEKVSPPFLPAENLKKFTLVLDLDETLVHYSGQRKSGELLIRPHCSEFLEEMNKFYEIVIFTAGIQEVINR